MAGGPPQQCVGHPMNEKAGTRRPLLSILIHNFRDRHRPLGFRCASGTATGDSIEGSHPQSRRMKGLARPEKRGASAFCLNPKLEGRTTRRGWGEMGGRHLS